LSITRNPYFCCQQLRHNLPKSSYDMSVFTWSLYTCFRLVPSCLNRINKFALSRIRCLGILAYDWQRHKNSWRASVCLSRNILSQYLAYRMLYYQRRRLSLDAGTTSLLLENVKWPISSIDNNKFSKYWDISAVATISSIRTRSWNIYRADFPISLWKSWFYRNSKDRKHARMVFSSITPCLRFSALPPIFRNLSSQFITRIVNGCRKNIIFLLDRGCRIECYLYACKTANRSVAMMFVLLSSPSKILDLTAEELPYIPKPVLLRVCCHYVHYLCDRLSEHLKAWFGDSTIPSMFKTL